ncbi:putative outer membrane starch-binding protein [Chitinophaga skermanii]|uniref:Putative outer membrane starch-binding protein n=1 Tax=Chitinophaga skermanii TaxID=331697 RepID=A0A327Q6N8_9BACT|nr:RagB/SusD family nutrient uptake outer membrane protein [Chitinophaga skermanii]RAI99467.1 putative outer membrane starch-binding protein [Chitinophaga skermanii]
MLKKINLVIIALALLTGCVKDPLNVSRTDQYTTGNYPATIDDANSILASCYAAIRSDRLFGFELSAKSLANATHTANSTYDGHPGWNEMTKANISVYNEYANNTWSGFYTGVKNCNAFLSAADFFEKNYAKPNEITLLNNMRGEALFLRAFYYFNLECLYGEKYMAGTTNGDKMGVPIYRNIATSLDSTIQPRASVKEVWDLIISDLQTSATLLKGKTWSGNDYGRITEWSAKGLLGKAYVFTQNWTAAKTALKDVIDHSGKSLMPYDKYRDAFIGIAANEFNEESLFEINVEQDSRGAYGVFGMNITTSNGLVWSPFVLGDNGTEATAIALGYGNEFVHDKNIKRFGFPLSTYKLVSNPAYTSAKPESPTNPKLIMDPLYRDSSLAVRANKTCDPRLFVAAMQPWIDSAKNDGSTWRPISRSSQIAPTIRDNYYGWSFRKYAPIFTSIYNVAQADACNYYFLRLADVYLLYAEACANSNETANALEYLNKVKRRAYGLPINAASAVDYKSLTGKTVAIDDPVLGNNPLYYERFAELFNEFGWWFDVCRWGIGQSEANFYGSALNATNGFSWDNTRSYSWPIPSNEINSNINVKGHNNPGY